MEAGVSPWTILSFGHPSLGGLAAAAGRAGAARSWMDKGSSVHKEQDLNVRQDPQDQVKLKQEIHDLAKHSYYLSNHGIHGYLNRWPVRLPPYKKPVLPRLF